MRTDGDWDDARDSAASYDRLTQHTSRETAVRLFNPERRVLIGDRGYQCTVTLDQYYGRDCA